MLSRKIILLLALLFPAFAFAADEERAQQLFQGLRCVVCEGQSLVDSQAEVAQDIRAAVRGMIDEGKTDEEIKSLLVSRYGEAVLMAPPFTPYTYLLWLGPLIICVLGLGIVFAYFSSAKLTKK